MDVYEFAKFKQPMGYLVPKEQDVVLKARDERRFLELILAKTKTTLTVQKVHPGLYRMYFTYGKHLFATEAVVKPKRSQIYAEALLAKEFLSQLQSYVCSKDKIITNSLRNEKELAVLADLLASTLKGFISSDFHLTTPQDLQFLIRSIWEKYMEFYHSDEYDFLKVELADDTRLHSATEYLAPSAPCTLMSIKIFDVPLMWPCTFAKQPIFLQALVNARHIPLHVKYFLADLCTQLDTNIKLEGCDDYNKREYSHRYSEMISFSLYQWHWLTNRLVDLQIKEDMDNKELRRTLKLFEADLAIGLYNALIERLDVPVDICETLELGDKRQIAIIVRSVVSLMKSLRDYEFKCIDDAWDTSDWKNHVKNFWIEVPREKKSLKRSAAQMIDDSGIGPSPPSSPHLLADVEVVQEDPPEDDLMSCDEQTNEECCHETIIEQTETVEEPEKHLPEMIEEKLPEMVEEDDGYYIRQDCLEVLAVEDFASCTIEMDEIDPVEENPLRVFFNKVLAQVDARLQITLKKRTDADGNNLEVAFVKNEKPLHSTSFCFKNTEELLDRCLNELILSLKDKISVPFDEFLSILKGQYPEFGVSPVVDYLDKCSMVENNTMLG